MEEITTHPGGVCSLFLNFPKHYYLVHEEDTPLDFRDDKPKIHIFDLLNLIFPLNVNDITVFFLCAIESGQ